ncbi:MAG: DUF3256 family protein [Muribaculaceae bacterium]|nr:DUF3256 family protein [Muribaculaceae bacterium]
MKMNRIIGMAVAGLICFAGFVAKAETSDGGRMTASEAFSSLPVSVLDLLDNSRRLDMLDYYAVDSIVKVPNTMEGVSYLEKVTPDYLKVCLTPVSTMTIKILPAKRGEIVMVAYTVGDKDQAYDTDLRFYDTSFNELKRDKFLQQAPLDAFFSCPDKAARKEVAGLVPFPTVRYLPDEHGTDMTAEMTAGQFLSQDDKKIIGKYLKPSGVRYRWTGSKFNLEK